MKRVDPINSKEIAALVSNMSRYTALSQGEIDFLMSKLVKFQIARKDCLLTPKQTCHYQFYVTQGTLRSYFLTDEGEEHTIQFAVEDWFISDFSSYLEQKPGSLFIEALEASTVLAISFSANKDLYAFSPSFETYFRVAAQKAFAFSQKRVLSNLGDTAEERYDRFQNQYPEIVARVPQYMLASYLGMSAEFLSKIRKRKASSS